MGILRKPYEEIASYITGGTPTLVDGVLSIDGFPAILAKSVQRVENLVTATAGVGCATTIGGVTVATVANSIFSITLRGFSEGAMGTRQQTVSVRQDAANSLSLADLNEAMRLALIRKFGAFVTVAFAANVFTLTAKVFGPNFKTDTYTDDTAATYGAVAVTVNGVYPVGQLALRANVSQPKQLRDLFPHLTEASPAVITTALDKVDVTVHDSNTNGGDGSGRKKVISFYGTTLRVAAIQDLFDITDTSASDQSQPAQQVQVN